MPTADCHLRGCVLSCLQRIIAKLVALDKAASQGACCPMLDMPE